MIYSFCPSCGTSRVPEALHCVECGAPLRESEWRRHADAEPITPGNFFQGIVEALERISIGDFFRTLNTAVVLLLHPLDYPRLERDGRIGHPFRMLITATFTGALKLAIDPVYGPLMQRLDAGSNIADTLVQIILYLSLAAFFGYLALIAALAAHRLLRLRAERGLYTRAMLAVFVSFSFLFDMLAPLWEPLVVMGYLPWGSVDLFRGLLVLIYAVVIYRGVVRDDEVGEVAAERAG